MASVPPLFRAELARLAHLPRRAGHMLLGSLRPLACQLHAPGENIQPWLAVWADERTLTLRGAQLINPGRSTTDGRSEALGALVHALGTSILPPSAPRVSGPLSTSPRRSPQDRQHPQFRPGLPERIYVDDAVLAAMADELVRPLGIPVQFRAHIPRMDAFFSSLATFFETVEPPSESESLQPRLTLHICDQPCERETTRQNDDDLWVEETRLDRLR